MDGNNIRSSEGKETWEYLNNGKVSSYVKEKLMRGNVFLSPLF